MTSSSPTQVGPHTQRSSRVTGFIAVAAVVSALGGFLFGFDTGIISGALLSMRKDMALSEVAQQLIVSALLFGAIFGSMAGGPAADRFGRKRAVLVMAAVFATGALMAAMAGGVLWLVAARLVLGVAVGAASAVVPVYIAEIAPARFRGLLVSMQEVMIAFGILCSYLTSYSLESSGNWRLMLGSALVPAVALFVGMLMLPESPRWLLSRDRESEATAVLRRACSSELDVKAELEAIRSERNGEGYGSWRALLARQARPALVIGVGLAFFNQISGINVVIYYAPTILSSAGLPDSSAILATVGVGSVMVLTTAIVLCFIDRVGRRPLFIWGTLGATLSLLVMAAAFLLPGENPARPVLLIGALMTYIASHGASLSMFWVVLAEVFPANLRGRGAAVGSITHWIMNFVVASTTLTLITTITPTGAFCFYAGFAAVGLYFVWKVLPETKGKTLEQVSEELVARTKTG